MGGGMNLKSYLGPTYGNLFFFGGGIQGMEHSYILSHHIVIDFWIFWILLHA